MIISISVVVVQDYIQVEGKTLTSTVKLFTIMIIVLINFMVLESV